MMNGTFGRAMFEEDCSFVEEILNVPRKIAEKIVNGESFYNPLTKRIQTKESLLKGDCDRRADRIKQWIDREEKRISDFPDSKTLLGLAFLASFFCFDLSAVFAL